MRDSQRSSLPEWFRQPGLPLLLPFFAAFFLFWVVPLIGGLRMSLYSNSATEPTFVGFSHYQNLLFDPSLRETYFKAAKNTLLYTSAILLLVIPFALILAQCLRMAFRRFRSTLTFLLLIPGLTPPAVLAILFLLVFHGQEGVLNKVFATPIIHLRSPLLATNDFKNLPLFASRLNLHADGTSRILFERFSKDTQQLLSATEPPAQAIADELNRIIEGPSLLAATNGEPSPFAARLSREGKALLETNPTGHDLKRLNRLALADAYPVNIIKKRDWIDWMKDPRFILSSLVIMAVWRWTGLVTFFILAGMEAIPLTLFEAAHLETNSRWRVFWSVTLPQLRPVILFTAVYLVVDAIAQFSGSYVLLGASGSTADAGLLMVNLTYRQAFTFNRFGTAAAISFSLAPFMLLGLWLCFFRPQRRRPAVHELRG